MDGQVSTLQDVVYGFMPAQILHVGARLGIADELADGPRGLGDLAAATGTHAPSLRRLLHGLACLGVLDERPDETYALTGAGEQLRADVPNSIRAAVLLFGSEAMWRSWSALEYSVRTGDIAWDHVHGSSFFDYMDRHSAESTTFNSAMADRTRAAVPQIIRSYDFSRFTRLVDVGGGNGQLIATILTNTPELRGVLFDQPAGVSDARDTLWAAGVVDRCEIAPGDFFSGVPTGGDAYLLKSVIHNWDDDKATTILRNCRDAMGDKGTLLLVERVMPARVESPAFGRIVWSDVNMLVNTFGRERTEGEYRALFAGAGFELVGRVPTSENPNDYQLLEGVPA
jgi:O-methyltransferase